MISITGEFRRFVSLTTNNWNYEIIPIPATIFLKEKSQQPTTNN
jgi:hypothetical protein